jgi:hypothetical protein
MCNQSVGLLASVIEKAGIPTVALSLLREITQKVNPPRSLIVPYDFGYPLGEPGNVSLQSAIIRSALATLETAELLPILHEFKPRSKVL